MTSGALSYQLPGASWTVQFSAAALQTLGKHVQRRRWSKESVGQLFSKDLTSDTVVVDVASVLTPAWSAWAKVRFDTERATAERASMFEQGLHCIGLWHTHPEPTPEPSAIDQTLAREHALVAQPLLTGIVFAILGTTSPPAGLRVWVDDGHNLHAARAVLPIRTQA